MREAKLGDEKALGILRGRESGEVDLGSGVGESLNCIGGSTIVNKGLVKGDDTGFLKIGHKVHRNGDVSYMLSTGGKFKDTGRELKMGEVKENEIKTVLLFAQQKFGRTLDISGTEEFKQQVKDVVAKNKMQVRLSGVEMERSRQGSVRSRKEWGGEVEKG